MRNSHLRRERSRPRRIILMKPLCKILPFICLAIVASAAFAEPKPNVDASGVGIQGYDSVAFFTDGKPVLGKENFTPLIMV